MGNGCGGNGNCCDNNDVGDSNINRMAAGAAIMMTMTAAAAAVATVVTMAVTMMLVAAVAEVASVAAPMVSAQQPHPNPQQYIRIIPFWNSPLTPINSLTAIRVRAGTKKLPPHRFPTVGIVPEFRQTTTHPPQTSSPWCYVFPPYSIDSMNCPNTTHGRPSEGVGRERLGGVLYKSIKKNRENNLILQLILFSTNPSPAVENGCQNGIQCRRRAPKEYK
jgi:hypothetical protein